MNLGSRCTKLSGLTLATLALLLACGLAWAIEPKADSGLSRKEFFLPELYISSSHQSVEEALRELPNQLAWESFQAARELSGQGRLQAFIDPRSGAATSLIDVGPLVPGRGLGNQITADELANRLGLDPGKALTVGGSEVAAAVLDFVGSHHDVLGVDLDQLGDAHAARVAGELWQVRIPQTYRGVPVRYGHLVATLKQGNLVLVGTDTWGNVRGLSHLPRVTGDEALAAGFDYVGGPSENDQMVRRPTLEVVPLAPPEHQQGQTFTGPIGQGYRHRLVWTFVFRRAPGDETWEAMVDAHSGEVIAFQDKNLYAGETISGGVYPVTSTEICPTNGTCGVMQSDWPMPFADTGLASPNNFTNSAGVFDYTGGTATTTLSGLYVNINDTCGSISNSAAGSIDLGGVNGDHDCTSGGGSAGNTPASRTAFYEVNKLVEQARGWLPGNTWLNNQLTANVNLNNTCNAFWNGATINFYRSGGGCRNTGELAGVFDHEWGHGLDDNDAGGTLSNTSEAYADIAGIYRLQESCVGHGFFETVDDGCGMTSDGTGFNADENQAGSPHCDLDCSGVRDADWDRHADHNPDTPLNFVCPNCNASSGPCGRQVHCSAAPVRQAAWDWVARDLAAEGYDSQTAFLIGNKVFYQGSGNVGTWYSCTCGSSSDGCGASGGYLQWLAADDDNGSLGDGTPHMASLYAAFNRHAIACSTPTPQNGGCAGGPTGATTLAASPGNRQISLSWNTVSGASEYWVMRSEGHAGCDFGKALIATVSGTSYTDTEVANGRDYYYNIVAADASNDACFGPVSNCVTAQPVGAPDFSVSCSPASHTVQQGANAVSTCTVSSEFGYTGTVGLSCAGNPAGISCSFVPSSVSPPVDGSANSTLTLSVDLGQATGSFNFDVVGDDGSTTRTSPMSVLVVPEGTNGPQDAVFNATYQAPACLIPGSECDTNALVDSRDSLSPSEPNQPNTIADSCADGTTGTYHNDESNDRIVVSTLDGTDFFEGATVEIDATVWAWSTGSSDAADFYYAADANSPSWVYITSIVPPSGGAHTLTAQYTLPAGGLQAVRVQFRYVGSASPCTTGSYNDRDDLVFAVNTGGPECTIDGDCADGLYCNGDEVCNAGTCEAGTAPDCSDGVSCTDDSCNEATDSCDNVANDANCDNGLFCDGAETCDPVNDCQPGTAPNCDDGVGCTDDSCNETTDSCDNVANDANCDNGLFCDGAETCDPVNDCQAGSDPCPGQSCDEVGDQCVACLIDADCSDGLYCNGAEVCNAGVCEAGTPPSCDDGVGCTDDSCNEGTDSCDNVANDANCDNGLFCDGAETCDPVNDCQPGGGDPCAANETCDEVNDVCVGSCLPRDASCTADSECCSQKCRGKPGAKVCK